MLPQGLCKKKPVDSSQIAMQLAERSSLQDGDVMSVLTQLSGIIAGHLHEGRTVSIDGLGNFFPTISSEGVEKPEECTADKVWVARIGFKAAPAFLKKVRIKTKFISIQLQEGRKAAAKKRRKQQKQVMRSEHKNNREKENEEAFNNLLKTLFHIFSRRDSFFFEKYVFLPTLAYIIR